MNFFGIHQLRQDLPGVEAFELLRYLVAAFNFAELLADFGERDGLIVANLGHHVAGLGIRVRPLWHQIQQHTDCNQSDKYSDENSDQDLPVIPCSSHP